MNTTFKPLFYTGGSDSDFTNQDLSNIVFQYESGYDYNIIGLKYIDFSGANLSNSSFNNQWMPGTNFEGANLTGTSFENAGLDASVVKNAIVSHNYEAKKWEEEGLMPLFENGDVLLWKHVDSSRELIKRYTAFPHRQICDTNEDIDDSLPVNYHKVYGNLGYPYELGIPFQVTSMCTAGPIGALQNWANNENDQLVLAIRSHAVYTYNEVEGVYFVFSGTPLAVYKSTKVEGSTKVEDSYDLTLLLTLDFSVDALSMIGI